jgi:hypothetical protein
MPKERISRKNKLAEQMELRSEVQGGGAVGHEAFFKVAVEVMQQGGVVGETSGCHVYSDRWAIWCLHC